MAKTIRDVAKRAGVSIATVSRVLNNSAQVKKDKRLRVEEAIESLGFIPNQAARSLVQKKTNGVGVLLPSLGGEFFSEFLYGIDKATRKSGHYVLISASHGSLEELKAVSMGMHQRVDGLIIMSPENDGESIKRLMPDDTRVVLINSAESNAPFDTINFNNFRGAFLATEYLVKQGHRHIVMLKGPDRAHDARERLEGYREALRINGISFRQDFEISGDFTPQGGFNAAQSILKMDPLPSAIFCANDQSAIGLMGALQNAGVNIPDTISIVGFDDIPGAQFTAPPLSSVRVGIRQLGVLAVERFMEMDNDITPEHRVLPVELMLRQSTTKL